MSKSSSSSAGGLLLGLCAGDRNGGPQRMAMRVVEGMMQHATTLSSKGLPICQFDRSLVVARYRSWFVGDAPEPQRAYDTGNVFASVFSAYTAAARRMPEIDIDAIVQVVPEAAQSAGVNPAHRNSVLAAVVWLNEDQLMEAVEAETKITHLHPQASATAVATALICRSLITQAGRTEADPNPRARLEEAVRLAAGRVQEPLLVQALTEPFPTSPLKPEEVRRLHSGGHSPLVLRAALCFLFSESTFEDALTSSMIFAGGANYCPVLVGSIGGALFGIDAVNVDDGVLLDHPHYKGGRDRDHPRRIQQSVAWLQSLWV
jgi:hypothetical protein